MPTPAYLSLEGTKQGLITAGTFTEDSVGNIFQEGHEDQILVQAFQHQVIIPRDPQSGRPSSGGTAGRLARGAAHMAGPMRPRGGRRLIRLGHTPREYMAPDRMNANRRRRRPFPDGLRQVRLARSRA